MKSHKAEKRKQNAAWSAKQEKEDEKQRRKDRKTLRKKWLKAQNATSADKSTGKRDRAELDDDDGDDDDDWTDLAREEKMAKRVRKGDVSQKEFDAEFVDLMDEHL